MGKQATVLELHLLLQQEPWVCASLATVLFSLLVFQIDLFLELWTRWRWIIALRESAQSVQAITQGEGCTVAGGSGITLW